MHARVSFAPAAGSGTPYPSAHQPVPQQPAPGRRGDNPSTPNIADRFADLLAPLSPRRRRGLIARLSQGYYEGWRPSRAEVAALVAQELRKSPR
jgi:hypothetical protein